jgi:hypothetical protein
MVDIGNSGVFECGLGEFFGILSGIWGLGFLDVGDSAVVFCLLSVVCCLCMVHKFEVNQKSDII